MERAVKQHYMRQAFGRMLREAAGGTAKSPEPTKSLNGTAATVFSGAASGLNRSHGAAGTPHPAGLLSSADGAHLPAEGVKSAPARRPHTAGGRPVGKVS